MGSGSVGSLFGGLISTIYPEVVLIGRTTHIQAINNNGLKIQGLINRTLNVLAVDEIEEISRKLMNDSKTIKYILVTTKAHQTENAAKDLKGIISKGTIILAIQNGLGTEEVLKETFPDNIVLRGMTSIGVCRPNPGVLDFSGKGITLIGYKSQQEKTIAMDLVELFNKAQIPTSLERNINGAVFTKTIVNCALNPLAAIYQVKNIEIYKQMELRKKARKLAQEAWNVAKKIGIKLIVNNPIDFTFDVIKKTGDNENSMLTDVKNKRKTEIDFLTGKIVSLGIAHKVNVSNNQEIYNKILTLEKTFKDNE